MDGGVVQLANAVRAVESGALRLADGCHDLFLLRHPVSDDVRYHAPLGHRCRNHLHAHYARTKEGSRAPIARCQLRRLTTQAKQQLHKREQLDNPRSGKRLLELLLRPGIVSF